jgi:hypothetical protein
VRLYFAPLFWLTAGALALAFQAYTGSSRFRARLSSDRLAEIEKTNGQRLMSAPFLLAGLYCAYAAIRTMIGGVDTWWLWILAAATQFAMVATKRAAGAKSDASEVRTREKMQRRHRRAIWFAALATACLYAAQPVADSAARLHDGLIGAAAVVLMLAALAGFIAAGWSAVWVSGSRTSDQEQISSRPPA